MNSSQPTKLYVLDLLRQNQEWISGEKISEMLGISRAAVGKHIGKLREESYWIEAVSRRGYRLKMEPDTLDINLIKKRTKTKIIGHGQWVHLEKTESTNSQAAVLGAAGAPEGSLVVADFQSHGRGRKGRSWFSAPRSIHFSILLRPDMPARKLSLLSLLACLAVQKTVVELCGLEACIKWPNDILLNNKKAAAVLVEASIIGGEVAWAVIGIGYNLNAAGEEFPAELHGLVTSVFEETGKNFSRNQVYAELINQLDSYYCQFLKTGAEPLVNEWKNKTDIIGQRLRLSADGQRIYGKAIDLNHDGLLLVLDNAGNKHQLEVGDYHTQ
jgi:BirA family biotin operon repressor/biotin-[acetyl-CoA-carboxylase] ligase